MPGSTPANGAVASATDADGVAATPSGDTDGVTVKPGRHRESTLYHALAGHGAGGDGRTLAELRSAALAVYEASELPAWRRSGFWTTSFQELQLEGLQDARHTTGAEIPQDAAGEIPQATAGQIPQVVTDTLPERARAGRIVQNANSTVHLELAPELAEKGVVFCPLEQAAVEHTALFAEWFSRRLTYERNKLEAANMAFWRAGAFLYVPAGLVVEDPFEVVYAIDGPGVAQYARTLVVGERASDFKLHEYGLANDFSGDPAGTTDAGHAQSLHVGASELYLRDGARCRLAHVQDWGNGEVFDSTTRVVDVGRDAYCHWLPALLGGHLVRQHLELAVSEPGGDMAFRGLFFAEAQELLDVFAVDLHETGPSGGDVHWRGAATGSSRASFEGLIQIDPGAQQTHTYLQIHSMMLSPKARIDAIPSVLVSADDVSASHGGTVGELDEAMIFYMQSRGLDRASAVRVIVEGFFEPLLSELNDAPLEELVRAKVAAKLARASEDIREYAATR